MLPRSREELSNNFCEHKLEIPYKHKLLPWGLKMISDAEPLLSFPVDSLLTVYLILWMPDF